MRHRASPTVSERETHMSKQIQHGKFNVTFTQVAWDDKGNTDELTQTCEMTALEILSLTIYDNDELETTIEEIISTDGHKVTYTDMLNMVNHLMSKINKCNIDILETESHNATKKAENSAEPSLIIRAQAKENNLKAAKRISNAF